MKAARRASITTPPTAPPAIVAVFFWEEALDNSPADTVPCAARESVTVNVPVSVLPAVVKVPVLMKVVNGVGLGGAVGPDSR
jgi:hypothetical protein